MLGFVTLNILVFTLFQFLRTLSSLFFFFFSKFLSNFLKILNGKHCVAKVTQLGNFYCWSSNSFISFHALKNVILNMNMERSQLCWPNYPTSIPSLVKLPGQFSLIWEPGNTGDARLQ